MQSFVDRFRAQATRARQAQSRVKALERLTPLSAAHVDSPFTFGFRTPDRLPDQLLHLEEVSVGYGDKNILRAVTLNILTGSRIGLLGYNGAGKSTLIKLLAGELQASAGQRTEAKDIKIGYFAQHQLEQLDHQASPLLHLQRLDPRATEKDLRNFLGSFAFQGDMATSPIGPLSGGEKARLVLAIIVYQKPNLLLLDEPTNHLDLEMRHALNMALQDYSGAMLVVSHDRHLLRTVTDSLLLVAAGRVAPFDGDLDDYRRWIREQDKENTAGKQDKAPGGRKQQRQADAAQRQQSQQLRGKLQKLEQQMAKQQEENGRLQTQLAEQSLYDGSQQQRLQDLLTQQNDGQRRLAQLEEQWLESSELLERLDDAANPPAS